MELSIVKKKDWVAIQSHNWLLSNYNMGIPALTFYLYFDF